MGQGFARVRLRARLLVGVAAVAIAVPPAHRALGQEQPKWQPWVEAGGMVGTDRSLGDVDLFIPVWQDQTSLLFGDLRGRFDNQGTNEGNFGLGFRTQVDPEWIVGGYGYFDIQGTDHDNTFYQVTLGLEAMSVDWDFRVNGYIPTNPQQSAPDEAKLEISGNTIQLRAGNETALHGFDGEVGWRLPFFPADGDFDVRAFIGGYYFNGEDADAVAGPRGRIEARLYDIDLLGLQSRLTVDGEIQWDNPRGTQAFGGLELRIPLGIVTGQDGPKLSPLDRRMVDRVQRDVDIVTQITQGSPEDVIVDELTVKTHTIYFANGTGGGDGTKQSPTDIANAVSGAPAGSNAIIVADGGAGVIGVGNPLNLQPGQALLGGDSTVRLTGADSGQSVNFHVPGSHPTLSGGTTDSNLIQMASGSQNRVSGLDLTGAFSNAVAGTDMERAIVIGNNIDGGDPGVGNGVYLLNLGGMRSAFVDIRQNTISNMSQNGVLIVNEFDGLSGVFTQTIQVADNTIVSAGNNGIWMETGVYSATLSQSFNFSGNSIVAPGYNGIRIDNDNGPHINLVPEPSAVAAETLLVQSGTIAGNSISDTGEDAIQVNTGLAGTDAVLLQSLAIAGNTISGVGRDGIRVLSRFYNTGLASQAIAITGNTISNVSRDGVNFLTYINGPDSNGAGNLAQAFAIDGNVIADAETGINVNNRFDGVGSGGSLAVIQQGEIVGNAISDTGFSGIDVRTRGYGTQADLSQSVLIAGNSVLMPGSFGILFDAEFDTGAKAVQAFGINGNTVVGSLSDGINVATSLFDFNSDHTSVTQTFSIDGNLVSSAGGNGIIVDTVLSDGESGDFIALFQNGEVNGNNVVDSGLNGIEVDTRADAGHYGAQSLVQSLTINDNTVANVGLSEPSQIIVAPLGGIVVTNDLFGDVQGSQGILIDPNTVTGLGTSAEGIFVYTTVAGGQVFTQSIAIASNFVSGGLDGIHVATFVAYRSFGQSTLSQAVAVVGNTVTGAARNGIFVYNGVGTYGSGTVRLVQAATIAGNQVSDSGEWGILEKSRVFATYGSELSDGTAALSQTLQVVGNTVIGTGADGIQVATYASAGRGRFGGEDQTAIVTQSLLIADNTVDGAGWDGIFVGNDAVSLSRDGEGAYFGGVVVFSQNATIANNSVTGAEGISFGGDGIDVGNYVEARGHESVTFSQSLAINDNTVVGNAGNGILVHNFVVATYDTNGVVAFTQNVGIDPNTVIGNGGDGIAVSTEIYGRGADGATQSISIVGNQVTGSGRDGIYVGNFLTDVSVSQTVVIAGNTVVGSGRDGIGVRNWLAGFYRNQEYYPGNADLTQALTIAGNHIDGSQQNGIHLDNNITTTYQDRALLQTGTIAGNVITDSGINGVLIGNRAASLQGDAPTIGQTLAIVGNTIDGVTSAFVSDGITTGGNAILVANHVYNFATLNQSLTIAQNTLVNVASFDAIYIHTFVAGNGATAGQNFTITGNFASANGGYGVAIRTLASLGGTATQSIGIVGNTFTNNFYGGVKLFASAGPLGTIVQTGSITGNSLTGASAGFAEGIDGVAVAGEDGHVTQAIAVSNNLIADNAVGVYLRAGDRGTLSNGTVSQAWTFTSNTITGNSSHVSSGVGGHGIYARNVVQSGGDSTQTVTLVSGNLISGNQNDGVRFVNRYGTQSAALNSNLGGGPVLNTITSNGVNFFSSNVGGIQLITK
jgi:hypothetical protein